MDTASLAQPAHKTTTTRKRGQCSRCGTTAKTLMAPVPNVGHNYTGGMYCMSCNPRFFAVDMHYSSLERLGA